MEHRGVTCDGCGIKNFTGARYRCNVCSDYDLCSNCYQNDASSLNHVPEHPVTAILPPGTLLYLDQHLQLLISYRQVMGSACLTKKSLFTHVRIVMELLAGIMRLSLTCTRVTTRRKIQW